MNKKALILGIGGQDGSYLAENLLSHGYEVHGLYRRTSVDNLWRIQGIRNRVTLHKGDLLDLGSVVHVVETCRPDIIFNEADQDDASWSFHNAGLAVDITYGFVAKMLAWLNDDKGCHRIKFFQPLSATVFGDSEHPQTEESAFNPRSPYACAKAACYDLCQYYREVQGLQIYTGIFYNHDSPRRGGGYLLQHITQEAVNIGLSSDDSKPLLLGSPDTWVDIGYAPEFMDAARQIIEAGEPDDYVVATGRLHQIRRLATQALRYMGVKNPEDRIQVDPNYKRADAVGILCGDISKLRKATGWYPWLDAMNVVRILVDHYKGVRR